MALYDRFGLIIGKNGLDETNYLFTNQEYDAESELYYYNARYYNPAIGRFISRDPMPGRDGDVISKNSYVYVKNNPLKYVDPSGETTTATQAILDAIQGAWEDLVVGIGNIANDLADKSPIVNAALNHPIITGAVIGVTAGAIIVGGVYIMGGEIVCGVLCPVAVGVGGAVSTGAVKAQDFILNSSWKDWPNYMPSKGWTYEEIQQTLSKGEWAVRSAYNGLNPGNPMNIVTNPSTGKSLIIDIVTKEIIQLGKFGYDF